jgi:hypothetical protein
MQSTETCSIDGCERVKRSRGLCKRHYYQAREDGSVDQYFDPRRAPLSVRFYSRVIPMPNGCIEWGGSRVAGKYGQIKSGPKMLKAHRVAWELTHGPIPDGLMVCHHCDNPPCVNVDHLFLGTGKDNQQDMVRKGRKADHNSPKTHCPRGHAYDAENTHRTKDGRRICRSCDRLRHRRSRRG